MLITIILEVLLIILKNDAIFQLGFVESQILNYSFLVYKGLFKTLKMDCFAFIQQILSSNLRGRWVRFSSVLS